MGKNKKTSNTAKWESTKAGAEHFTRIHDSLLISKAFTGLNARQRVLYIYMKSQYKGEKVTKDTPNGNKDQFRFNWAFQQEKYKLYTNKETFYKDIKALEESGFIICAENNRNLRKCNVYQFSDEWKKKG